MLKWVVHIVTIMLYRVAYDSEVILLDVSERGSLHCM